MEQEEFAADPQKLHVEAQMEPRRRCLGDYRATILLLKDEKGFSLREIAAWLQQRGLDVDHNAVWRTYSKETHGSQSQSSYERIEHFERRYAQEEAMPWLNEQ